MNVPFTLPDWLPWWVPLVLLLPALVYALAFLFMPFSVIGLKTRMEALEGRIDDLHHEIGQVLLRMPATAQEMDFEEVYAPRVQPVQRPPAPARAENPRPPQAAYHEPLDDRPPPSPNTRPIRATVEPHVARAARAEPHLDRRR